VFCHVAWTTNHVTRRVEHFESAKAVQAIIIIITQFTIHLILGCSTNAINTGPTGTNHICSTRITDQHLARAVKVALKISNNAFYHVAWTTNHVTCHVEHFKSTSAVQAIIIVITQFTIHLILGCYTNAINTAPTGTKHICATRIANCLARAVKVALKVSNNVFCHVAWTANHVTHHVEHFKSASTVQAIIIVITQFTIHLILGYFTNAINTGPTGTKHICATRITDCLAHAVNIPLKASNNVFCHVAQTTNHVTHRSC
jgi:hypothetical protein